jgi:membrane associated rhomboid family serine protease
MTFLKDVRYRFLKLSVLEKLIIINSILFIGDSLVVFLFQLPPDFFMGWFELPKDFLSFAKQPWSIATYAFFHGSFFHLFWNMLLLYFSGILFLNLFSPKRFIAIYLLGGVFGGLLFLLGYNLFPVFSGIQTALIGASASVMAILIFVCTYTPHQEVRLLFFNVRLWYIGVFFVILDLVQLPMGNSGGHLAHLGGAFLGFIYARKFREGKAMSGFIFNFITKKKKSPLKTVYKHKPNVATAAQKANRAVYQRQIDTILDKISKSGYESLSKEEKDFLFKAGRE